MIKIVIPPSELWDERNQEFVYGEETVLELEHSLVSISKWESKWNVPFISATNKTREQTIDYIKCMTLNDVEDKAYLYLTNQNLDDVEKYISAKMTATWIVTKQSNGPSSKQITSELVYYWMFSLGIPLECENWHFNRLITLIEVFNAENAPKDKVSKQEVAMSQAELNAKRRAKLKSKG